MIQILDEGGAITIEVTVTKKVKEYGEGEQFHEIKGVQF
jgi:hypothetical protein